MSDLLVLAVITVAPLLILGLVALFRGRREDIPAIMRELGSWRQK